MTLEDILRNPQSLNSYSYANNNPITYSDPEGRLAFIPLIGYILTTYGVIDTGIDVYDFTTTNIRYPDQFTSSERMDSVKQLAIDVATFGVGRAVEKSSRVAYDAITTTVEIISNKASEASRNNQIETGKQNTKTNSISQPTISTSNQSKPQSTYTPFVNNNKNITPPSINVNQTLFNTFNQVRQGISNIINSN